MTLLIRFAPQQLGTNNCLRVKHCWVKIKHSTYYSCRVMLCGAMVLGKLPVPGRPATLNYSRAKTSVLAEGASGIVWTFFLSSIISLLSPSLWETIRYRLKYCLKEP